jgi:type IV pilus assembly protein PilN
VILINLLPHREAARKRRKDLFFVTLGIAAILGLITSGLIYGWYQAQITSQQGKNTFLQAEVKLLETQIKDVATLQTEIVALKARQQAVEDLQSNRNLPVHIFTELIKQLPDGVYLTSMKQDGINSIALVGMAQSNERVAEFLRNLSNNSVWFAKPELVQTTAAIAILTPRDQRRVYDFQLKTQLRKPADVQKPATTASAPVSAALPVPSAAVASAAKKI